jgi:hypothetical protein
MTFSPGWYLEGAPYAPRGPRPWTTAFQPRLVAVTDACAIASSACHVARNGTASILASLASTGRSNVLIGEDVEAELPEALAKVAADMGVPLADAERALGQIMTRIRVVPLRMGDYLNPRIAAIRRFDPDLPRAMRGDPDDLGTAAVAEFLAPAVIISKDSVFNRFGLALPADRWTEEAARLLAAAGYDATLEDAARAAEHAAGLLFNGIVAVGKAAARNPKATLAALVLGAAAGWYCHRRGWITGDRLRAAGQKLLSAGRPVAEHIAAADARRNRAQAALTVVSGVEPPSLEERCARHLARRRTAMTAADLASVLSVTGPAVTAEAVRDALDAHPAFTSADDGVILGRPASSLAVSGGTRFPDPVTADGPSRQVLGEPEIHQIPSPRRAGPTGNTASAKSQAPAVRK